MYVEPAVLITLIASLIILLTFLIGTRISLKYRIKDIENALDEVLKGNDSLHLFTNSARELDSLILHINQLMDSYRQQHILSARSENARKQLISNLSHDVRTPLASVIGYLEAIENGLVSEPEKSEYMSTALAKAYALKERIDQLFELARLDADEVGFHFELVDMYELTRNIVIDFVPLLEQLKFKVEIDIPDAELIFITDRGAVTRILQNLIRNAITHGGNGQYLGIHVYCDGVNAVTEVTDHGKGISETDLPYIFDRLYQGSHARSTQGGLGLTIAKELSRKLGGNISASSSKEITTFTLFLPIGK